MPEEQQKEKYIGSVRFFKNMILLTILFIILVLSCLTFHYAHKLHKLQRTLAEQHQKILSGWPSESNAPEYQKLYPDFYAKAPLNPMKIEEKTVYLTFDDGPSDNTRRILNILQREGVKATFFVIGAVSKDHLAIMRDIVNQGHSIAMHTYTHEYSQIYASVEAFLEDQYRIYKLIKETTGVAPSIFRFPGGSINNHNMRIYREIMAEMLRRGFVPYDWNVSSGDAAGRRYSSDQIVLNVISQASRCTLNPLVLMHDAPSKHATVEALPGIIHYFKERGFRFGTLEADIRPILFNTTFRKEEEE